MTTSGGVLRDAPTTVVRFRDVTQQPDYAVLHKHADAQKHKLPHSPDDFILSHAGQPVAICLPPVEPAWHWRCGVERVWRAARALGYRRLITYTLGSEPGTSLVASGWKLVGAAGGGSWNRKSRPRVDTAPTEQKKLWEQVA